MTSADAEWLIIGAGLHGAHLAAQLRERGVAASDITLVDPQPLFQQWRTRTRRLQMSHLRSPSVHHIGPSAMDLESYAGARKHRHRSFRGIYARPRLSVFDSHCDAVAKTHGLAEGLHRRRALRIEPGADHVTVHCDSGTPLIARQVVLALGVTETARPSESLGREVRHVFDPRGFELPHHTSEPVVVIGAGVTGAQLALALVAQGNRVELVSRHPLRTAPFDSDPCWIGPACMERFERQSCFVRRRTLINTARNRGTMPAEIKRALVRARNDGVLDLVVQGEIDWGAWSTRRHVFLATGFTSKRPGGVLVDRLVTHEKLPVAPCGYPRLDSTLRWHPRVFVMGALAELELGPTARNIVGARRAAARIMMAASPRETHRPAHEPRVSLRCADLAGLTLLPAQC